MTLKIKFILRGRRHRALQRRRQRVARVRPDRCEVRRRRDRQLERMAHGPRVPARRAGGQHGRRAESSEGHHRQPELLHHPDGRCAEAAARRRAHQAHHRVDLPGDERQGTRGRRGSPAAVARGARGQDRHAVGVPRTDRLQRAVRLEGGRGRLLRGGVEDGPRDAQDHGRRHHRHLADHRACPRRQRSLRIHPRAVPSRDEGRRGEEPPPRR